MSTAEIHDRADRLNRRIRIRNLVEYIAAVVVIAAFGSYTFVLPGLLVKIGSVMLVIGTLIVVWQLHRRASPLDDEGADCAGHLRAELGRQRDALRSVALWYLGPLVPGMAVFLTGLYIRAMPVPQARERVLIVAALCVAVFALVWALNAWTARRLKKQIDALDR